MKIWKNALIYMVLLFVSQSGTMYLFLRVWHYSFVPSAFIAACITTFVAVYAGRKPGFGPAA